MNDFVAFILTHGRPDHIYTTKTLRDCGYTGPIVYVVDNEDKTLDKYYENFGEENIEVFDKKRYADSIDEGNNFDDRKVIVHARNACFDIAKKLGYTYFIQLDDDYTDFRYKIDGEGNFINMKLIRSLDEVFKKLLDFYKSIDAKSIALSQGGDWIGGVNNASSSMSLKRKAMNSFICSIERPFTFVGALNEDVNTYTVLGSRGNLFFTIPLVALQQKATQSQESGMTDIYKKFGTFIKSFTTVMMLPSSVVASYQESMGRIHHKVNWRNTVPKILSEEYKK